MLGGGARFPDALAGRKGAVRLLPVLHRELPASECAQIGGLWSRFDPTAMQSFARLHPKAALWLVAEDRQSWTARRHGSIEVTECGPAHLP